MLEHGKQREAGAEVFMNHIGAPHIVRAAFAQTQQAGGVINLAVHQNDGADPRVTQGTTRLHGGKTLQLCADVG